MVLIKLGTNGAKSKYYQVNTNQDCITETVRWGILDEKLNKIEAGMLVRPLNHRAVEIKQTSGYNLINS